MSIEAINTVWKWTRQKGARLLVLLGIADFMNKEGDAYPAVSTLAKKGRMSKRNVQRCLRALENAGELKVLRNQGRRGSNIYRIRLCGMQPNTTVAHVTGDAGVAKAVTPASSRDDTGVTQSVSKPSIEPTPIVPKGDDENFWIQVCFDCFKQAIRPVPLRARRAIIIALPRLKKEHASSLLRFYRDEPLASKKPAYSSRRHSPERLMRDLERQLAFAGQEFPPPEPPKAAKEYPFTLDEICQHLRENYSDCRLPRSLAELDTEYWPDMLPEIYEALRMKNKKEGA